MGRGVAGECECPVSAKKGNGKDGLSWDCGQPSPRTPHRDNHSRPSSHTSCFSPGPPWAEVRLSRHRKPGLDQYSRWGLCLHQCMWPQDQRKDRVDVSLYPAYPCRQTCVPEHWRGKQDSEPEDSKDLDPRAKRYASCSG